MAQKNKKRELGGIGIVNNFFSQISMIPNSNELEFSAEVHPVGIFWNKIFKHQKN